MTDAITDFATLEACVGKVPGSLDMKVMDHLDSSALQWLTLSTLMFAAFGSKGNIDITIGAGIAGFVHADNPQQLRFPLASLDESQLASKGQSFGSLFLLPGINETLRINGRVVDHDGADVLIAVDECYLHCAKALIRSDFWASLPNNGPSEASAFLAESRFMALATIDSEGRADISPKGDPAGAMLRLQDGDAWYADRPGNRRVDSFRNILTQPRIAALAIIPGSTQVLRLNGSAQITTNTAMREVFTVRERVPKIVTRVAQSQLQLLDSAALKRTAPWPVAAAPANIDPAAMFVAHVKESKARGLQAKIARAALSVPGLMEKGLHYDYKKNLY